MDVRWKPKFGRSGATLAVLSGKQLDSGIVASSQVGILIPSPWRRYALLRASFQQSVVAAGGAAINLVLTRNSPSLAPTSISYNVPIDIRGLNANQVYPIPFAGNVNTAVLPENIYQAVNGDLDKNAAGSAQAQSLFVNISAGGTVTTQPVGLIITIEIAVLE